MKRTFKEGHRCRNQSFRSYSIHGAMDEDGWREDLSQFEEDDDEMTTEKMYGLNKYIQVIFQVHVKHTVPVHE